MVQNPVQPRPVGLLEFFVHPETGDDRATGDAANPYKTVTYALRQLQGERGIIRLHGGVYSQASGETFPLILPPQVSLLNSGSSHRDVVIEGGGDYVSPTFGLQQVTLVLQQGSQLRSITVSNPAPKGTGVWIEDQSSTIANCTFIRCGREGILVTGNASPSITNCVFRYNGASGITFVRHAKGEFRGNLCRQTGFGLVISDYAAPLLVENQILENRSGIVLSGAARPVLRKNLIEQSAQDGLAIFGQAQPELGHPHEPAGNTFRGNGTWDLRNASATTVISVGNPLNPLRISGAVDIQASQLPGRINPPLILQRSHPQPIPRPPAVAPNEAWAAPFIRALRDQLMIEVPDLTPTDPITRAEYATWITRVLPQPEPGASHAFSDAFSDVPAEHEAAVAITQAVQMGWLSGFPDHTFRPDAPMTRLQVMTSLVQGLRLAGEHPIALAGYRDQVQIPSQLTPLVAAAVQHRLVVSYPHNVLRPLALATKAEVAAMIYQARVLLGQAIAIPSAAIADGDPAIVSFSDIHSHWAAYFIRFVGMRGLMEGTVRGLFEPDRAMTRSEYARSLIRLLALPPQSINLSSLEGTVSPEEQAIAQICQAGLLTLEAEGRWPPEQLILRWQVLQSLVIGLRLPIAKPALLDRYEDAAAIPDSARPAMASATAAGLVVNYPQVPQLRPHQPASRAEVAALLYMALVHQGLAPQVSFPYRVDASQPDLPLPLDPNQPIVVVLDPGHGGADPGHVGQLNLPPGFAMMPGMGSPGMGSPRPPSGMGQPGMPQPGMPSPMMPPAMANGAGQTGTTFPSELIDLANLPQPKPAMDETWMGDRGEPPMPPERGSMPTRQSTKLLEKDIVLALAQLVAELLQSRGIQVVLTRSTDQEVTLSDRLQMAAQARADLLVSLHAGAADQPEVNGIQTLHPTDSIESARLAQAIHRTLLRTLEVKDQGVQSMTAYPLAYPAFPAIQVEVGYVTGRSDALNLINPSYQTRLAQAITDGILKYVQYLCRNDRASD